MVYKIEDTQKEERLQRWRWDLKKNKEKKKRKKTSGGKEGVMQIAPRGKHPACV